MPLPLPKRKRVFTPKRNKQRQTAIKEVDEVKSKSIYVLENEVETARVRLKGALKDALEPTAEESDESEDYSPVKRVRKISHEQNNYSSGEEDVSKVKSPQRQSYVLKLFDRSVDLSQFSEDSPLYPICRAWIANRPKANYSDFGKEPKDLQSVDSIDLPGPEGPPISKIPDLIPEQKACSKDNIDLNYHGALPTREELLTGHISRWAGVREAWLARAARVEARYQHAQRVLTDINVSNL